MADLTELEAMLQRYVEAMNQSTVGNAMLSRLPPAHGLWFRVRGKEVSEALRAQVERLRANLASLPDCAHKPAIAAGAQARFERLEFYAAHIDPAHEFVVQTHDVESLLFPIYGDVAAVCEDCAREAAWKAAQGITPDAPHGSMALSYPPPVGRTIARR